MSFQIKLQQNTSPANRVDKGLNDVITVDGVLRDGTSIIDPVVVVETELSPQMVSLVNYATIEEFGRHYFVTNVLTTVNGLWEIHMHVDVLMSYRNVLRQQTAVLARSESAYNMMLDDGWFMAYQNPRIQTKYLDVANPFGSQEYVLVVAGS